MNLTGQPVHQKGQKTGKSPALRNNARDQKCTLAIPGVCNSSPATTVGCHLRLFGFGGMGIKPDDLLMVDCCSACHATLDSRDKWAEAGLGFDDILRAFMHTLMNRRASGLILLSNEIHCP